MVGTLLFYNCVLQVSCPAVTNRNGSVIDYGCCWFLYFSFQCSSIVSTMTYFFSWEAGPLTCWASSKFRKTWSSLEDLILKDKWRLQWFTRLSKRSKPSGQLMAFHGLWDSQAFNRGASMLSGFVIWLLFSGSSWTLPFGGNPPSSGAGCPKLLLLLLPVATLCKVSFSALFDTSLGWFCDPVPYERKELCHVWCHLLADASETWVRKWPQAVELAQLKEQAAALGKSTNLWNHVC